MDPQVAAAIFRAKKPNMQGPVNDVVGSNTGSYTVFSLDAVLPGRPESIPVADRDAGKQQLAQQAGGADYTAFVQALYEQADVVINQDIVAGSDLLQ